MKILLVHNYYGSSAPSGENNVLEAEKALLEKHGHKVAVYVRHSDEIRTGGAIRRLLGKVKGALCMVGNPFAAHEVAKNCRVFKPDIVHFHNTFPLISPLAIRAAHRSGAKVVVTPTSAASDMGKENGTPEVVAISAADVHPVSVMVSIPPSLPPGTVPKDTLS